ncbi:peritrophin-44 [Eurosta solidaginis]|uniref:peritrophin-44 n=1 Tax=Eurosta solidaginis TaxID=178769 RepID=UPI00353163B6
MRKMDMLTNFAILMLIAIANANFNATITCSLLSNGIRIKDPDNCNSWITCIEGAPHNGTCASELFYDRNTQTCVNATSIKCISNNPCAPLDSASGFTADPYTCNGYYYCNEGVGTRGACGTDYNFDPNRTDCVRGYVCGVQIAPDSYCNILPDGVFIKNPNTCNGYQLCWHSEVLNLTCPKGYYYNALKGDCDYTTDVKCAEAITYTPPAAATEFCGHTGIFVSDRESCNGYYYCAVSSDSASGIELKHGVCPNGRFFCAENGGECVPRINVVCSYNRCVGSDSNSIVLANVSNDGCHGYTICQGGMVIGNGTCPDDGYFDELTQICTNEVVDFPACATWRQLNAYMELFILKSDKYKN